VKIKEPKPPFDDLRGLYEAVLAAIAIILLSVFAFVAAIHDNVLVAMFAWAAAARLLWIYRHWYFEFDQPDEPTKPTKPTKPNQPRSKKQ